MAINEMPTAYDYAKLWHVCSKFIEKYQIFGEEAFQSDDLIIDSPNLVNAVCEIIGYWKGKEEDGRETNPNS